MDEDKKDPLFDQISSTTLESLKADVVFDNFFKDNDYLVKLRAKVFKPRTRRDVVVKRLKDMGVDVNKAHEIAREMIAAGTLTEPDRLIDMVEVPKESWYGGNIIREPFTYDNTRKR